MHLAGKFFGAEATGAPDSLHPVISVAAGIGRDPTWSASTCSGMPPSTLTRPLGR